MAEITAGAARPSPDGGRLNALLRQANANIFGCYKKVSKMTEAGLARVAIIEQRKTQQVVNQGLGANVMTAALTEEQLQSVASDVLMTGRFPWQWWHGQETALQGKFEAAIRDGIGRKEGVDALVCRVRGTKDASFTDGIMAVPRRHAETLIRTLVQAVANQTRLLSCEKNAGPAGVVRAVALHATLDGRQTTGCQALHGLQWDLPSYKPAGHEEAFPGPCLHFGCRSTWVPVLDGQPAQPETDKGFLDKQSDATLDALLGPARAGAWRKGKLTVAQALDQRSRPLPVGVLAAMVDKGHSVPVPRFREGDGRLSLSERALLDRSHAVVTQDGKVLAHFLDANTGQSVTFEGTSPRRRPQRPPRGSTSCSICAAFSRMEPCFCRRNLL